MRTTQVETLTKINPDFTQQDKGLFAFHKFSNGMLSHGMGNVVHGFDHRQVQFMVRKIFNETPINFNDINGKIF